MTRLMSNNWFIQRVTKVLPTFNFSVYEIMSSYCQLAYSHGKLIKVSLLEDLASGKHTSSGVMFTNLQSQVLMIPVNAKVRANRLSVLLTKRGTYTSLIRKFH